MHMRHHKVSHVPDLVHSLHEMLETIEYVDPVEICTFEGYGDGFLTVVPVEEEVFL